MPGWGDATEPFLARVLPWPASEQDAGYGNIHWATPNTTGKGPKAWWTSKPFKSAKDAASFVQWLHGRQGEKDIYFCTSLQAQTTKNAKGKVIGYRDINNTLGSKVLFLDIDVKPPPKGYPDLKTAYAELKRFVRHWDLPFPTALVGSGGGLHAYWISNRTFAPNEWRPMAESLRAAAVHFGLLCDGQCTVDIVRILRPPETHNHKTVPPRPVKLIGMAPTDLDFEDKVIPALSKVPKLATLPSPVTNATPAAATAPAFDPAVFKKRPIPSAFQYAVGAGGVVEHTDVPLDTKAIFKSCAFLGEALRTGGEHHDQPQWNIAVLASTFFGAAGRKLAHAISDRHSTYTPADTEALYDRKEQEKATKDMGWPSCVAIEQAGSKACATCPLRGTIRSPLNTGVIKSSPAPAPIGVATFVPKDILPGYGADAVSRYLPDGYALNSEGIVSLLVTKKDKNADGDTEYVPELIPMFFRQRLLAPYVQENPLAIHFTVDGNLGEMRQAHIQWDTLASPTKTWEVLLSQGVIPNPETKSRLGDFLMTLSRMIEEEIENIQAKPFGWVADVTTGKYTRFAYGGRTFGPSGSDTPGGYLDTEIKQKYAPIGVRDPWLRAADFIVTQTDRPDLHVVLASAFAGPFMQFTGENLGVLHHWGDSGKGKSTVMMIAQAVWGHPEAGRIGKTSTENYIGKLMATLRNLPMNWDEVTTVKNLDTMVDVVMSNGQERSRLVAKSGLGVVAAQSGTWSTMMVSNSNHSLVEHIAQKQKDHLAGRYRVFEFKEIQGDASALSHWNVGQLIADLRFNFGNIGLEYARVLAEKVNTIDLPALVIKRGLEFDALVKAKQEERFWSKSCACLLVGAEFARDLGFARFDLDKLQEYLVEIFLQQRDKLEHSGQEGESAANELLTGFFKENWQKILITDGIPQRGGARGKTMLNMLKHPMVTLAKGIEIQFVDRQVSPIVRVCKRTLNDWLVRNGHQPNAVYERIAHRIVENVKLGAGTPFVAGPERVMEIDIVPGSWLAEVMASMVGRPEAEIVVPPPALTGPVTSFASNEQGVLASAAIATAKDNAS